LVHAPYCFVVCLFGKQNRFFQEILLYWRQRKGRAAIWYPGRENEIWAFVISAGLAGIAGILLSSRLGAALATSGRGLELRVITAVILGGASLSGGYGKIWGAFLGALFMAIINNILIISRVSGYWQEIILGTILIAVVGLDQWLLKRIEK
jgi:ribose transport system permease protein